MKTTLISRCCNAEVQYKARGVDIGNGGKVPHQCTRCLKGCNTESVCADCLGSGEVSSLDYVYAGEPHMADVKLETCHCKQYAHV